MDKLPFPHALRVAANSTTSASAPAPTTAATPISSQDGASSRQKHSADARGLFNDPFTGVPSTPSDVNRLFFILSCEYRPSCLSIPASLFLLFFCAPPWSEHRREFKKQITRGQREFQLDCSKNQKLATYLRLYTEWLFSGGAPSSLAKLHRHADGSTSVSFSPRVRACIYILRLYCQRGYPLGRACNQITSIFTEEASFEVSEESWQNVVIVSEPVEVPSNVWPNAFPTPALPESSLPPLPTGPSTFVQTEPFRGIASLQPSELSDVPQGWTLWTPVIVPPLQLIARRTIYKIQSLQSLQYGSTKAAAPSQEYDLYREGQARQPDRRKIRFFSPDVIAGAEEESEDELMSDEVDVVPDPRMQLIQRLTKARQIDAPRPGRSRKSSTPAPTKASTRPTRLRLIAPRRPSTPEQAVAFEESMHSSTYNDDSTEANVHRDGNRPAPTASLGMNQARYFLVMAVDELRKEKLRDAGQGTEGVGLPEMAGEDVLFNPLDWE